MGNTYIRESAISIMHTKRFNLYCQCKTPKNANWIDSRGNYAEMACSVMLP